MIDNAPTIPNALARLLPITMIETAVIIESIMSEFANEEEKLIPSYVHLYKIEIIDPQINATRIFEIISLKVISKTKIFCKSLSINQSLNNLFAQCGIDITKLE
jgi:hypothetical protein